MYFLHIHAIKVHNVIGMTTLFDYCQMKGVSLSLVNLSNDKIGS